MPRTARIVVPGQPHHITQRGNNRQNVFFSDKDRRRYLEILYEQSEEYGLKVTAYCLMSNHLHLVATPSEEDSLTLAVGRTHWRYTQYINRARDRSGHLWQNRFFSCPVVGDHALAAIRYVERNPVRAKIVRVAWRYPWSSAAAHCDEAEDQTDLLDLAAWDRRFSPDEWKAILKEVDDEEYREETYLLRAATRTGRPRASDRWIKKLEIKIGRSLRPGPRGRPPNDA